MIFFWAALFIVLLGGDIASKYIAVSLLEPVGEKTVIDGFFYLSYVENRGMAFGMLKGGRWIFVVLTAAILLCVIIFFLKNRKRRISPVLTLSLIMICSGAVGNLIDRIRAGYVVDFLRFVFFGHSFAVFNFADILVTCGTALLCLYLLFEEKKEEK